jgi:hypothetical protein
MEDKLQCALCGEDHPAVIKKIEQHHVFGKNNSSYTIALCNNCHNKTTYEQNKLAPKERSNFDERKKLKFLLISIGGLLKTIGEELLKQGRLLNENNSTKGLCSDKEKK